MDDDRCSYAACGFESGFGPADAGGEALRDATARLRARLGEVDDPRTRPAEGTWSSLEYRRGSIAR